MNIETGKHYLTRNGRTARVICTDARLPQASVIALIQTPDGGEVLVTYTSTGQFGSLYQRHEMDLVEEVAPAA